MYIKEFSTFFKIKDPNRGIYKIIKNLKTVDYRTKETKPFGYFYNKRKNIFKIPKGVGKKELISNLKTNDIIIGGTIKPESKLNIKMKNNPFTKQAKVIDKVLHQFKKEKKTQAIIDMPTGEGKTFSGIYIAHKLNKKPLIFIKNKDQAAIWAEGFIEHTNIKEQQIFIARGKKKINYLLENGHKFDVFITTHRTTGNYIKNKGYKKLNEWFIAMDVGVKIFDEFDLEVDNMLKIDCHSSFPYNLYLTATPFKSSVYDDKAFQYMFKNVYQFGKELYKDKIPNRDAHLIFYKSKPNGLERRKCYSWYCYKCHGKLKKDKKEGGYICKNCGQKAHMIRHKYHIYMAKKDTLLKPLIIPIRYIKKQMREDINRKHIFFTGRVESCEILKKLLIEKFNIDKNKIGIFNSDINANEKKESLKKPIIVSISKSMGRALDIKNIKTLIDLETYKSPSDFEQLVGRIGRKGGLKGKYFKIVDLSFLKNYIYYKGLKKYIDKQFDKVKYTKLEEDK